MAFVHLTPEEISSYVDDERNDEDTGRISQHLECCPECKEEFSDLRLLKSALGKLEEHALPRSFVLTPDAIATVPNQRSSRLVRFEPVLRLLSVAAAVVFILLGSAHFAGLDHQSPASETPDTAIALEAQDVAVARSNLQERGAAAVAGFHGVGIPNIPANDVSTSVTTTLTTLEIATIGVGGIALVAVAAWILIRYRMRDSS